jgi:hypothetical protein
MSFLKRFTDPVALTITIIGLLYLFADYKYRWKDDKWQIAVHTDAADYYRYLPMVFVEHQFDPQTENPEVVKYFCGTAICYLPFFGAACLGSVISGLPPDGYSMLFPVMISIGTLFYFLTGLVFFARFLRSWKLDDWIICTTLAAIALSTIVVQYTILAPGWAHIPAFALCCILLCQFRKAFTAFSPKVVITILALGSLLFFVRPTDVLIFLMLPFLGDNKGDFGKLIRNILAEKKALMIGSLLAAVPALCQVLIYRWGTGEYLVYSYSKEGFDFLHPYFSKVLFSYEKGLFVYTPICFLALFGLIPLYRMKRRLFRGVAIALLVNTYVISSWWCWNYGASYGTRAFIEFYPLFFLPFAFLLTVKNFFLRGFVFLAIAFTAFLNIFQTYQANTGILDYDLKTNKKGYWHTFLRTDRGYSGKFYRFPADERPENVLRRVTFYNDFEREDSAWINPGNRTPAYGHSGHYSSYARPNAPFSTGKYIPLRSIPYGRNVLVRVSGWFFVSSGSSGSFVAISFVSGGKSVSFNPFSLDGYLDNFGKWEFRTFELQMPAMPKHKSRADDARMEVYMYNDSKFLCLVDDLKIELIEFRKMERPLDLSWDSDFRSAKGR